MDEDRHSTDAIFREKEEAAIAFASSKNGPDNAPAPPYSVRNSAATTVREPLPSANSSAPHDVTEEDGSVRGYDLEPEAHRPDVRSSISKISIPTATSNRVIKHFLAGLFLVLLVGLSVCMCYVIQMLWWTEYARIRSDYYYYPSTTAGAFLRSTIFNYIPMCNDRDKDPNEMTVSIDAPAGLLSFSNAKAVDFAWNMVVGRGGQILMILIAAKVFRHALTRIAEGSDVSLPTFAAISLQPVSLRSYGRGATGLFTESGWRIKCTLVWMFLAIGWIFIYPHLMDLATGYQAYTSAYVSIPGKEPVHAWDLFPSCPEKVYDGKPGSFPDVQLAECPRERKVSTPFFNSTDLKYSVDTNTYGVIQATNLTWFSLEVQLAWDRFFNASGIEDTVRANASDRNVLTEAWGWNHVAWNREFVDLFDFQCVVEDSNTYQWGFWSFPAYVVFAGTAVWALVLWIIWVDAELNSRLYRLRTPRTLGGLRAAMDVADAVNSCVEGGPDTSRLSEAELRSQASGKVVRYRVVGHDDGYPDRKIKLTT